MGELRLLKQREQKLRAEIKFGSQSSGLLSGSSSSPLLLSDTPHHQSYNHFTSPLSSRVEILDEDVDLNENMNGISLSDDKDLSEHNNNNNNLMTDDYVIDYDDL